MLQDYETKAVSVVKRCDFDVNDRKSELYVTSYACTPRIEVGQPMGFGCPDCVSSIERNFK